MKFSGQQQDEQLLKCQLFLKFQLLGSYGYVKAPPISLWCRTVGETLPPTRYSSFYLANNHPLAYLTGDPTNKPTALRNLFWMLNFLPVVALRNVLCRKSASSFGNASPCNQHHLVSKLLQTSTLVNTRQVIHYSLHTNQLTEYSVVFFMGFQNMWNKNPALCFTNVLDKKINKSHAFELMALSALTT